MDRGQAPMMDVLCITLRGYTGHHQAAVLAAGDAWCAHGRRPRILSGKPEPIISIDTHSQPTYTRW
jgi:hypothetical protein